MEKIKSLKKEEKTYIPYQLKDNGFVKLKESQFTDFSSIISSIEETVIEYLNKQQSQKNEKITTVGIDKDAQSKIKINGYKGDKLVDFYNNMVEKTTELIDKVNEKIQENIDYNGYVDEKNNKKLVKSLLKIRNNNQPSCRDNKFKTSWFFSSAFSEKITSDNGLEILKEMYKDLETCIKFMISIIQEFCNKTGIVDSKKSFIKFDLNILMYKDTYKIRTIEEEKKRIEEEKRKQQQQQQYQQQHQQQQYQRMYYGGKKTKKNKIKQNKTK